MHLCNTSCVCIRVVWPTSYTHASMLCSPHYVCVLVYTTLCVYSCYVAHIMCMYSWCVAHIMCMYSCCVAHIMCTYSCCVAHIMCMYSCCVAHIMCMYSCCLSHIMCMYSCCIVSHITWKKRTLHHCRNE